MSASFASESCGDEGCEEEEDVGVNLPPHIISSEVMRGPLVMLLCTKVCEGTETDDDEASKRFTQVQILVKLLFVKNNH